MPATRRTLSERALDLTTASARASRSSAVRRARRLRARFFFIAQCAVAAAVAYVAAKHLFGITVPLYAPVAAIVTLGMSHGQRLRRALEIMVGVAVGAAIGETFVHYFGIGWWQVLVVVGSGMTIAALLDQGTLIVTQAGIQGMIVALLSASPDLAAGRWFEAIIGSTVGLVFAAVVPTSTLLKPRSQATRLLDHLAAMLASTADALDARDIDAAQGVLDEARRTERDLDTLRGYAADSADVLRISPFHRRRRDEVVEINDLLVPLDRAIRNARVLIRRAVVSLQVHETVPAPYASALVDLAEAVDTLAEELSLGHDHADSEARLLAIGAITAEPADHSSLSAEVIRAQMRSMAVDLLMAIGLESDDARDGIHQMTEVELGREIDLDLEQGAMLGDDDRDVPDAPAGTDSDGRHGRNLRGEA